MEIKYLGYKNGWTDMPLAGGWKKCIVRGKSLIILQGNAGGRILGEKMRLINSNGFWYNVLHGGSMNNIHVISIQHGYLLKTPLTLSNLFDLITSFKQILQNQGIKSPTVDLQRINLSDLLFRLTWDPFSLNVSTQRVDLFFTCKYAPDNKETYRQIVGKIRSLMSALFSFLNGGYGIHRLGLVGNYMLLEKDISPLEHINKILLNDQMKNRKFSVQTLEGYDPGEWKSYKFNDVKRVWDANYNVPGYPSVRNLGIIRDINISFPNKSMTDEEYNEFINFAEEQFLSCDAIIKVVS